MEGLLNNLSLVTYNCRGFKSSMPDVQKVLNKYQIIFLQETWLSKQQLDNVSCFGVSHFAFGKADYDIDDGPINGRGHGVTATYWSKNLKASSFSNCDGSIIGLRVCFKNSELCLINVYIPYCSRANTDELLAYLGKLRQLCQELQCPNIRFVGNFNAGATKTFGGLLEDFCMENDFIISDYALLPQDTFTYISDAHNTTSWIDDFVSSFAVHQAMFNMEVLTECVISDHRAVVVNIQCSNLPEFDEELMDPQPSRIDWLKVTAQEREDYYHESKNLLDQLQLHTEVRHCQNFDCKR